MESNYLQKNLTKKLLEDGNIFIKYLINRDIFGLNNSVEDENFYQSEILNFLISKKFEKMSNVQKLLNVYLLLEFGIDFSNDKSKEIILNLIETFKTEKKRYSQLGRKSNIFLDLTAQILFVLKKIDVDVGNSIFLIDEIILSQKKDGGWGFEPSLRQIIFFVLFNILPKEKNRNSSVNMSIDNLLALIEYRDNYYDKNLIDNAIEKGILFLLNNHKSILDNNLKNKFSTFYNHDLITILSIIAKSSLVFEPRFTILFNSLISMQNFDDFYKKSEDNNFLFVGNEKENDSFDKWNSFRIIKLLNEIEKANLKKHNLQR